MVVDAFGSNNSNESAAAKARERSSIGFPYKNLGDAIVVARAIHSKAGHSQCSFDQLAGWMGMSPKSSGFKVSIGTAKMFGLVTNASVGHYKLTPLGIDIVDHGKEKEARAKAFLAVPLYKKVYDAYLGSQLPPEAALERAITEMGVASKQKTRARQVMLKSAEQAGFLETDATRMIMPAVTFTSGMSGGGAPSAPNIPDSKTAATPHKGGSSGGGSGGDYHPFIEGLLKTLPDEGTDWSGADRVKWLRLAAGAFDMIYSGDANITIGES